MNSTPFTLILYLYNFHHINIDKFKIPGIFISTPPRCRCGDKMCKIRLRYNGCAKLKIIGTMQVRN